MLKSDAEIEIMAEGGRRLAEIINILKEEVRPGVATDFLEKRSRELIKKAGSKPAFLGYRPSGSSKSFPAALCVSINDIIVHGLPSSYVIKDGDLVKLDLGLIYKGFYLDSAVTVGVGKISKIAKELIFVTEKALELAIKEACPGKTIGDIGFAVQNLVESNNFSIAESLCGHEIGRALHEGISIFNSGSRGHGHRLEAGLVIAIEPMITSGKGKIKHLPDDSYATADGSLSAHFEHTVAITKNGPRVLTR